MERIDLVPQDARDATRNPAEERQLESAALASLKEDLAEIGIKYDAAETYNMDHVRDRVALVRLAACEARANRAVHLLLSCIDRKILPPHVDQIASWAQNLSDAGPGEPWALCPAGCGHFLIDHYMKGGCRRCGELRGACQMPGLIGTLPPNRPFEATIKGRLGRADNGMPTVSEAWWLERDLYWFVGRHIARRFPVDGITHRYASDEADETLWYRVERVDTEKSPALLACALVSEPRKTPPERAGVGVVYCCKADISDVWEEH